MRLRLVATGALCALVMSAAAHAQHIYAAFTIDNVSGADITAIHAGPSWDSDWGPDILEQPVRHGQTVQLSFENHDGDCLYDIRYEFSDGTDLEEYEVDICQIQGQAFEISATNGLK